MKTLDFSFHDWHKVNLVSLKNGGDKYRCLICGAEGIRPAFAEFVKVTEANFKTAQKCTGKQKKEIEKNGLPVRVRLDEVWAVGVEAGTYDVLPAPQEHQQFKDDVWVYSKKRKEIVRILPEEIKEKFYAGNPQQ